MRILLTSDWYTPAVNGVVASVLNLKAGLEARGHDVRVLTLSQTSHSYSEDGVIYIGSKSADRLYPGVRIRTAPGGRWIQELCRWQPEIIHSNCEFFTFPPAHRLSEILDVPLIHTYHTVYEDYTHYFFPNEHGGEHLARMFTRWISRRTHGMIAPTEKTAALLRRYGIEQPVYVIPTGIDLTRFQSPMGGEEIADLRRKWGIPEEHTVLAAVGRIAKEKHCEELLEAVALFRGQPVTLLFVGDGPYRAEVEAQMHAMGLESQVIFTGMVPPEQVWQYYRLGDLFVCASTSETQGLTYIEAMASGLPLLCRRDDCLNGVVLDGRNGWQYDSLEAFRKRLTWFLENRERWETLRRNARETGDRFSIPAFAQQVENAYLELLP